MILVMKIAPMKLSIDMARKFPPYHDSAPSDGNKLPLDSDSPPCSPFNPIVPFSVGGLKLMIESPHHLPESFDPLAGSNVYDL